MNEQDWAHHRAMSRRDFTRRAVLAAGAAALAPGLIDAVANETPPEPPKSATPVPTPASQTKLSPSLQAEAEERIAAILRRYGERLSADQKSEIRRIVTQSMSSLEAFRAFELQNGDEPATVLHLYRREV